MYKNILVAVDADEPASWADALPVAAELEAEWSPIGYREMLELARVRLLELAATLAGLNVDVEVGTGTICGGVLEIAERVRADLIVLASHVPELKDYLLSANAARVARRAACSVLVVRSQAAAGARADQAANATEPAG